MAKFALRRWLAAIPTIFLLITISFFMMRLAPGNPFSSERTLAPEVLANLEARYHLDAPLYKQYLYYLRDLLHGDLGLSFKYKDYTVNQLVGAAFPVSLKLGATAFLLAVLLGLALGILAAFQQNLLLDHIAMALATFGIVTPSFVSAPILVLVFSLGLGWLPAGGWNGGQFTQLVLPVLALSLPYIATISRMTRSAMIEVLHTNFIRTARAKGLSTFTIVWKHALKPALIPIISYLSPAFVGIITGSIVIENIFGLPGLGQLFLNGALNRDYGLVMSLTILVGILTILFNLIADLLYALIDPKVAY